MPEYLFEQHLDRKGHDLEVIDLEWDENGSPVTLEPGNWFVCFVPGLQKQWWHVFVHKIHKTYLRHAANGERRMDPP